MTNSAQFTRRTMLAFPLVFAAACKAQNQVLEISGFSMGTSYKVVAIDPSNALDEVQVKQAISSALANVNDSMSNWQAGSEISRLNASPVGTIMPVSAELTDVLNAASYVYHASEGRFDTTVGPLIELWGFGAPGARAMPHDADIAQALTRTGLTDSLRVGQGTIEKTHKDAQAYLAGIGKGYGADHIGRALTALGIEDYLVEIGGDLYAEGRNPNGQPWQVGIETPNVGDRGVLGVVGVSGLGVASSGDYRNYFEEDGQRYSHLIDPTTGRPVTHKTASATVLAENAMLADAWSTALLILGRERGLDVASAHNVAVQFVERDQNAASPQFKTFTSEAFEGLTA
ncbi:FAD:protein FMN transferase [Roseobacter sp.]|uniref:FAD:protein FMN transferase n=1 Tax=Roseobacter sp. TaxID=1907202 RepID=UPI00329988C2